MCNLPEHVQKLRTDARHALDLVDVVFRSFEKPREEALRALLDQRRDGLRVDVRVSNPVGVPNPGDTALDILGPPIPVSGV